MGWWETARHLIGDRNDLAWWQLSVRGVVVFLYGLLLIRFLGRRIFSKASAFDIILAVLIGSSLSRALTGNAPFVATLAATGTIVALHWLLARLALYSVMLRWLVKGGAVRVVADGQADARRMASLGVTMGDIEEAMREDGVDKLEQVRAAYLERDGKISIVPR